MMRQPGTKARLAALVGLSVLSLGAGASSLALLTDTATVTGNFVAATVDITVDGQNNITHDWAPLFAGTGYADSFAVSVRNAGSAELRTAIDSVGSSGDPSWATVTVTAIPVAATSACPVQPLPAAGTMGVGTGTLSSFTYGDPAPGQDVVGLTTDLVLAPGETTIMCFMVSAPSAATSAVVGAYTQQLNFRAEQTYLNP